MRNSLFVIIILFAANFSYSQYEIGVSYGFDHISIGNKHTVNWTIDNASSLKFSVDWSLKNFDVGIFGLLGKYRLNRPTYSYDLEYSKIGIAISKKLKIYNKFSVDVQLSPYARIFDKEFYTASLIIDSYNIGLRLDTDLVYEINKKWNLTCGYSLDKDIYRAAINSDEITNFDRFINMFVNSIKLGISYKIENQKE